MPGYFAPMLLVSTLLMLRGLASADTFSTPTIPAWSVEAGARLGSLFGGQRDRDEEFYEDVGLTTVDKDGKNSPISLSITSGGLDLAAYKRLAPRIALGLGASFLEAKSEPDVQIKDAGRSFASQKSLVLRLRIFPFLKTISGNRSFSLSIDPAVGYTSGTLRRFTLAKSQLDRVLDTLPDNVKTYVLDAGKPVNASGPRLELAVNGGHRLANGLQFGGGLGVDYTKLQLDSDPLAHWTTNRGTYPKTLEQFGFFVRGYIAFGR